MGYNWKDVTNLSDMQAMGDGPLWPREWWQILEWGGDAVFTYMKAVGHFPSGTIILKWQGPSLHSKHLKTSNPTWETTGHLYGLAWKLGSHSSTDLSFYPDWNCHCEGATPHFQTHPHPRFIVSIPFSDGWIGIFCQKSTPWQPSFPKLEEQSTNCCSDRDTNWPVASAQAPSKAPVVLKAQQEPHCCLGSFGVIPSGFLWLTTHMLPMHDWRYGERLFPKQCVHTEGFLQKE